MKKASKIPWEQEAGELIYIDDSEFELQKEKKNPTFQKDNFAAKKP